MSQPLEPHEFNSSKYNKPRPLRPNMGYFGFCFLVLITLGFYVPFYYKKFIAKINVLAKDAGTKKANFSHKFMLILLAIFWGALPAMVVLEWILPVVLNSTIFSFIVLGAYLGAALIIVCYCVYMINHVPKVLLEIAYKYDRMDAVALIEETGFSWREKASFDAFDILAEHYNNRIGYSIRRY